MQPFKKTEDNSSLDYSFLFSKLAQLSQENSLYRNAFAQIENVAKKVAAGNLSARITHWDQFDKLTPTLCAINQAYDFADNFIHASEETQQTALIRQDELRKGQLRELKDYFEKQVVPALR